VFGYDNCPVLAGVGSDGRPHRTHVERVVNEAEAAVVRRIFEMSAAGIGVRGIAITLNSEGVAAPVPRRAGRARSWAPSTVREILHRELDAGRVVWGRVQKRDRWGLKRWQARPEAEWVVVNVPALRIVSEGLWAAAHIRLTAARAAYLRATGDQAHGRPPARSSTSKYLLTGLAECACCGGGLIVRSHDYRPRRYGYHCAYHHQRGRAVCGNALEAPMEGTDHAVLEAISNKFLRPAVVDAVIAGALDVLLPAADAREREHALVVAQLRDLEGELSRLAAAIAVGGNLSALVESMKEREQRRIQLEIRLLGLEARPSVSGADRARLAGDVRRRLDEWRTVLTRQPEHRRVVLDELLTGQRIRFTPEPEKGLYTFKGWAYLDGLITGRTKAMVTPAGFEPAISTLKGSRPRPG
jgi:site-specific DNA recombinase